MIKHFSTALRNYHADVQRINLDNFNKFIFRKLLMNLMKFNNILPFIIAISVIVFSIIIQQRIYVFIPQGSLTSFVSYMIFTGAISLLVLVLYPLFIIFLINFLGQRVRHFILRLFFPIKLVVLTVVFYICITLLTGNWLPFSSKLFITGLWISFYFVLINFYLAYLHDNSVFKFTKYKIFVIFIFAGLLAKPYAVMFIYTSTIIDYTAVNPMIYLTKTNCQLISNPIYMESDPANLTINDKQSVIPETDGGCLVHWGAVRYGFASDYVLIFKKNIYPIKHNGSSYNVYVRLMCYSGNCYSDDDKHVAIDRDINGDLIKEDKQRRLVQRAW